MDISERDFEATIERALLAGGPDAPAEDHTTGDPLAEGYEVHDARAPYHTAAPTGRRETDHIAISGKNGNAETDHIAISGKNGNTDPSPDARRPPDAPTDSSASASSAVQSLSASASSASSAVSPSLSPSVLPSASSASSAVTSSPSSLTAYRKRAPAEYDRALCLIPRDVIDFLYATQPKEWERFQRQEGNAAKARLLARLAQEVTSRGTLAVLREGIKVNGCKFHLAYFRPASGLNPATQTRYEANLFAVTRQLHYSERDAAKSLDLALFLNGLPLFTAELKNPLTGQTVQDAVRQYRHDRDPREPLFALGRCLAHFAVDPDNVQVATRLEGPQTRFLPFNQGRYGGAGNPPNAFGYATSYLWQRIWARDSVLELVQRFVQLVEDEDDEGRKTGKRSLIFPRYHQLDAVRRLVRDARERGPGERYLIQHSAGSGKSNTIAWLAHQLSILHDDDDRRVFDSIVVVTDRRVLDHQLQRTVRQFEQTLGVVENIDKTSSQLKTALENGKTIIVTTLQKFPVIAGEIGAMPGQRFAVIVDEAHSSQTGESTHSLKLVLTAHSLEEAEEQDVDEGDDLEDRVAEVMRARGRLPNVSFFAFTATPKPKTLELFGRQRDDGKYEPFSLYTMRQAIEEGFILDVLQNYTTYKAYWSLLKTVENDPRYDRRTAEYLLKAFVDLHPHTISKKVEIVAEHFHAHTAAQIGGQAKAMIVTRSRLHAVRYKLALDAYLRAHGYPYKALVAFSGMVHDGPVQYTESSMNGVPERQTVATFKRAEYRFLIVANKFQTGFDQPLLHTMYVDKKLGGVNAVQTLSRLNRTYPGKDGTLVLDFANDADEIEKAFTPYYDRTLLAQATDPNSLYDLQTKLLGFRLFTTAEVDAFSALFFAKRATQDRLHAALNPIVARYLEAPADERVDFRGTLNDYVRRFAFLSQVLTWADADLEKLYEFARMLLRKLLPPRDELPVEIQRDIDLDSLAIHKTGATAITLTPGAAEIATYSAVADYALLPQDLEPLSQIIKLLNDRFGTDFSDDDKLCIQQLEQRLEANDALDASVRANSPRNARLTFEHVVNDLMQDMVDGHFKFYKQVTDNPDFAAVLLDWLFERYLKRAQAPVAQSGRDLPES